MIDKNLDEQLEKITNFNSVVVTFGFAAIFTVFVIIAFVYKTINKN